MYSPHLTDQESDFYRSYMVENVPFSIFVVVNFVCVEVFWLLSHSEECSTEFEGIIKIFSGFFKRGR